MGQNDKQASPLELAGSPVSSGESVSKAPAFERHYSVDEIARLWNLSKDSVRRLFRNELGVIAISPRQRRGTRSYVTLRIPESVAERVHRRLSLVMVLK